MNRSKKEALKRKKPIFLHRALTLNDPGLFSVRIQTVCQVAIHPRETKRWSYTKKPTCGNCLRGLKGVAEARKVSREVKKEERKFRDSI